ncbi:MAG: DUF6152 family protein [Arenicellaceae bacterium]|nr:DUF6152 family protein [Arenicellaceae bacterium]
MKRVLMGVFATLLGGAWPLQAHHSYISFFQVDERIRIEGVVEKFMAQNPHGYVVLNVVNEEGELEQWRAEMPGWVGMRRGRGWLADDLKPGDHIAIVGAPARFNDETLIRADDIVMPDGWTRHLFNDLATGKIRSPTPPAGLGSENDNLHGRPTTVDIALRTDGEWPGLDIVWQPNTGSSRNVLDIPAPRMNFRDAPLTEAGREAWANRLPTDDPGLRCEKPTLTVSMNSPTPIQITKDGDHLRVLTEHWDAVRTIYMDGRTPPSETPHTINGFSTGRYVGGEVLIQTSHITAGYTLRVGGPPHSDELLVTERYRVLEEGPLLEAIFTVEDPVTFSEPISWERFFRPAELQQIQTYDCQPSPGPQN